MSEHGVIFDLDGTLVDTLEDIAGALNHVLEQQGLPAQPLPRFRSLVGEGVVRLVERAIPGDAADRVPAIVAAFKRRYAEHLCDCSRPYDGIPAVLDALAAHRVPMAILSNKPDDFTRQMAKRLLGRWRFAAVVGQREGMPRKPDPAPALALVAELGVAPSACAFVGDTKTDMQTARAAGMMPVGVLWGFRERAELEAHGARHVVSDPEDLLPIFGLE